jgi:hypothetical protein
MTDSVSAEPTPSRDSPWRRLAEVPHLGIWVGVVLVAAGVVLLFVAWAKTAGLTNVSLQIPYVISAGATGLGLVVVGLAVARIGAALEDAKERSRQSGELSALVAELRQILEPAPPQQTEETE